MVMVATGSWKNKGSKDGLFSAPPQANSNYYRSGREELYLPRPRFCVAKALLCDILILTHPANVQSRKAITQGLVARCARIGFSDN